MAASSDRPDSLEIRPLEEYQSVQTWFEGLRRHWGGDPASDDPERLPIFEAFCRYAGKHPDEIIAETTFSRDGERRIRTKGRRRYAALIDEWQEGIEGSKLRKAKWGNTVRSFLIHNGVFLQSGVQA